MGLTCLRAQRTARSCTADSSGCAASTHYSRRTPGDPRAGMRTALEPWLDSEASGEQRVGGPTPGDDGLRARLASPAGRRPEPDHQLGRGGASGPGGWAHLASRSPSGPPPCSSTVDSSRCWPCRGRDHTETVAVLDALVRVLNHPEGGPLWQWLSSTSALARPSQALRAAAVLRDAAGGRRCGRNGWGRWAGNPL